MTERSPTSPYFAGLLCKCPRCGEGALFDTFLGLRGACAVCDLDYKKADSGDGPAVFVIFIVGFLAVAIAFIARFSSGAPIAIALIVSTVFTIVATLALLRPFKATLVALQYANKAEEGRVTTNESD